ncbi:N-acetylneuraminate synthase [Salinibacter ruber]|nr:N-acetylneuraminate synthase [Salinibacter ruber]
MGSTYIIAEAGVNHNGSLDKALELVDAAAQAGADAVKFQTFKADRLVSTSAPKANYQKENTDEEESQFSMLRELELSYEQHAEIVEHCGEQNIQFLSTPYDVQSLHFLVEKFEIPYIKVPSAEITNGPFLWHVAQMETPVILSTGMSLMGEIEDALSVLAFGYLKEGPPSSLQECKQVYASDEAREQLKKRVHLLHCTSEYPAPVETVNLRAMETLHSGFELPVGYSDHTEGIEVPIAAVARGAEVLEKHFTLNRDLPGPDHHASLEPDELAAMVRSIRNVERALGEPQKHPVAAEWDNRKAMRRSMVANRSIVEGEEISEDDLVIKRPGTGLAPIHYWDTVGRTADKAYKPGDPIQ